MYTCAFKRQYEHAKKWWSTVKNIYIICWLSDEQTSPRFLFSCWISSNTLTYSLVHIASPKISFFFLTFYLITNNNSEIIKTKQILFSSNYTLIKTYLRTLYFTPTESVLLNVHAGTHTVCPGLSSFAMQWGVFFSCQWSILWYTLFVSVKRHT